LEHFVRSWDVFAPPIHLHDRQESRMTPPDHAELCLQEIRDNTEANAACQALIGMIRDSA